MFTALPFVVTLAHGYRILSGTTLAGPDEEPGSVAIFITLGVTISVFMVLLIVLLALILRRVTMGRQPLQLTHNVPGQFDDEQQEEDNILNLAPEEQQLYKQGKLFLQFNQPELATDLSLAQYLQIDEKGISAWDFIPDKGIPTGIVRVENRSEIEFRYSQSSFPVSYPCSILSNLPIPRTNDVYYFESKLYSVPFPDDTQISIGLATKPYPFFRLPGRHQFSIAYDDDGSRRFNNSFLVTEKEATIFPKLVKGDVVGIGYRTRTGTIFFTHNGKKLSERKIGGHISNLTCLLYPTIGASNNCQIHVNVGRSGYVFIEANVKKWGFASIEGTLPPPPPYDQAEDDVLIDTDTEESDYYRDGDDFHNAGEASGNEEASGASIPNFPPPFWASNVSIVDNITLNSLDSVLPPVYSREQSEAEKEDGDEDDAGHVARQEIEVVQGNESGKAKLKADEPEPQTVTKIRTGEEEENDADYEADSEG